MIKVPIGTGDQSQAKGLSIAERGMVLCRSMNDAMFIARGTKWRVYRIQTKTRPAT